MNAEQARKVSIVAYLAAKGLKPSRVTGDSYMYRAPYREDRTPSMKVTAGVNLWWDFGIGEGGNAVDLAQRLEGSVKDALLALSKVPGQDDLWRTPSALRQHVQSNGSRNAGEKKESAETAQEIKHVGDITSPGLWQYLDFRCIDRKIAALTLKEIRYYSKSADTVFWTLGWPCGDGWNTRNKLWKGLVGQNPEISVLNSGAGRDVVVFEGWMDFLSMRTKYHLMDFQTPAIILHSTSHTACAVARIQQDDYARVYLYLDNDEAGERSVAKFRDNLAGTDVPGDGGVEVIDRSCEYAGYTDYNAYWMACCAADKTSIVSNDEIKG